MAKRLTMQIVTALLILFLIAYVIFQAQRFFYKPVTTETAYEYTVSRSLAAQGIAMREETLLDQAATGTEFYPLDDSSRVGLGETVAELHRGRVGESNIKKARALEEEIQGLVEAQNTPIGHANTESNNKDIKSYLGRLAAMSSGGRFQDLPELRHSLTVSMNRKLISSGKAEDFSLRIGQLEKAKQQMARSAEGEGGTQVTAPAPGYFSRKIDGYENLVRTDDLSGLTVSDCLKLIEGKTAPKTTPSRVGRIVLSEKWVFAAAVPAYNTEWIREGQAVKLQFDQLDTVVPAKISQILQEKNNDTAILLLKCDMMNEELVNLRISGSVIHFQQYTGIRISTADLRFLPDKEGVSQRGVYILDDHVVRFKVVDPIYEEQSFLLSQTYYVGSNEKKYVRLFDQVITKYRAGVEIYDGKTIQDY